MKEVQVSVWWFLTAVPCLLLLPCSIMGCLWAEVPLRVSLLHCGSSVASFHDNISRHVLNHVPFHIALHLFFSFSREIFSHTSSEITFCVSYCVFLSLSPFCTSCPQLLPLFLRHAWSEAWSAPRAGLKVSGRFVIEFITIRKSFGLFYLVSVRKKKKERETFS